MGGPIVLAAAVAALAVAAAPARADAAPQTPIKHLVVIFDENESFDHYFGTYPNAKNPPGQPRFEARAGTPAVNGLTSALLTANPNAANPRRLDRSEAVTCDQDHGYKDEQLAFNNGLMNRFVESTSGGGCSDRSIVMAYYDGNTVTALWNLAQHFAMSDNTFASQFGPSTPGAIELVSGNTHGLTAAAAAAGENGTIIGDPQPVDDDCSNPGAIAELSGRNIGDEMSTAGVTWGWFQGGFRPTSTVLGKAFCNAAHTNVAGGSSKDYIPHHEPFQYYASTANPHHLPPTAPGLIGQNADQANHQYDLADFDTALANHNLPEVSFLKPAAFEDSHPGYSGPLDEQRFLVRTLNALQQAPEWASTAVIIAYDDSDGWYDHVYGGIANTSQGLSDALTGAGQCGVAAPLGGYTGRCGYGPRLPLLVVSPYAKQNYVDHTLLEQTSILRFIEDNWSLARLGDSSFDERATSLDTMFDFNAGPVAPELFMDASTGLVSFELSCKATGSGRKITVKCTASGDGATTVRTALKLRVERSGKVLATARKSLSRGKATVVLRPKRKLRHGTYTVRIAVTRAGRTTSTRIAFRVK